MVGINIWWVFLTATMLVNLFIYGDSFQMISTSSSMMRTRNIVSSSALRRHVVIKKYLHYYQHHMVDSQDISREKKSMTLLYESESESDKQDTDVADKSTERTTTTSTTASSWMNNWNLTNFLSRLYRSKSNSIAMATTDAAITTTISPPTVDYPYCIFINGKSGGKSGKYLLHRILQSGMDKKHVCDLYSETPTEKLSQLLESTDRRSSGDDDNSNSKTPIAICCGGDGTMKWIMDESSKVNVSQDISFAIVPLGTGNDLFNHLVNSNNVVQGNAMTSAVKTLLSPADGSSSDNIQQYLNLYSKQPRMENAFDRWQVTVEKMVKKNQSIPIENSEREDHVRHSTVGAITHSVNDTSTNTTHISSRQKMKTMFHNLQSRFLSTVLEYPSKPSNSHKKIIHFNNYLGIGIDGDITSTFHTLRRYQPQLFFHRLINKMWYAIVWIYRVITARSKSLSRNIEIFCDDKLVNIQDKELQGVILTNINSYAGGSKLWPFEKEPWQPLKSDDGMIEVVGLSHFAHLAILLGGLAKPIPLAQGKNIKIVSKSIFPMQIDGEPSILGPSMMEISPLEKVRIVVPNTEKAM